MVEGTMLDIFNLFFSLGIGFGIALSIFIMSYIAFVITWSSKRKMELFLKMNKLEDKYEKFVQERKKWIL